MPRRETPAHARRSALESDFTPLYAVAGLTDALTDVLRSALAETQSRARQGFSDLQSRGPALQQQALNNAGELRTFVITLPEQVRQLPEATKARITELQTQANDLIAQATATYAELAGRGKLAVDEAVEGARTLSGRVEKQAEDLREEAGDAVDPLLERVQEGVTQARKNVSGRTATESVTPRDEPRSPATRRADAAKKAAQQAEAIKEEAAKRATPPKKTPAAKKAKKPTPVETTSSTEKVMAPTEAAAAAAAQTSGADAGTNG